MRPKSFSNLSQHVSQYVENLLDISSDSNLQHALNLAKQKGTPPLQVVATDGRHLEVLARSIQAKKIVEIGTLCGYSALFLAKALPEDGKLYTCEASAHHCTVAKQVFADLNLTHKIEVIHGKALDTLPGLQSHGPFDLVFIDADKLNYPNYFDWAVQNLRSGGLLVADNVFVFGFIGEDDHKLPAHGELAQLVAAMQLFNQKCATDSRLVTTILPTGEGMLVAIKK
ncbi:MAG: O-methyltransferase [Spirobacillus cienkowskii]|uniref:O-methyltransferase n=1 Tax=Spirobacillus cienkowskii TaxID=495820 RepID=A0A369KXP6_9BACT|nr:MAG: O-methyltransferase [Spirobacillus cienkowskii]